jgi:hypothetical protein
MKIIESEDCVVNLESSGSVSEISTSGEERLIAVHHAGIGWIDLNIEGTGYCVWPNREGEGFYFNRVYPVLEENCCLKTGLSLSWPATASTQSVALFPSKGPGILFGFTDDAEGAHREIRIKASSPDRIRIRFSGRSGNCAVTPLNERWVKSRAEIIPVRYQFQAGLIGPAGECGIPGSGGFSYLPELGELILDCHGPFREKPILHLFGYAKGHDTGYPDYTPSESLGGAESFKQAIEKLHALGFLISCYLNARIIETEMLSVFPHLEEGLCYDTSGTPVLERYFGREFYVMNPGFTPWLTELENQAMRLKALGADIIQLDQVAGRAATVPPGEAWGKGYAELIDSLRNRGLKVWIQGVSDYYHSDYFEMTWRDLNILPDGTIRGGNPFGETDLTLLKTMKGSHDYLVPRSKIDSVRDPDLTVILDVMGDKGGLPLVNRKYLDDLKRLSLQ